MTSDLRIESGGGLVTGGAPDFGYGRAAWDLNLTRPIAHSVAVSLGGSAGASAGQLPTQRWWRLGGLQTVRGQAAGTMAGDSYWLGHAELGANRTSVKPVVFYDVGWAGSRHAWQAPGRPMSGAGIGASFLDGLIRFDVAKGIFPGKKVRADFYVEARF